MQSTFSGTLTIRPVFTVESITLSGTKPKAHISWNFDGRKQWAILGEGDHLELNIDVTIPNEPPKSTVEEALRTIKEALK